MLITFLISGLWHGAGLTFIVWGFLQGVVCYLDEDKAQEIHKEQTGVADSD